MQFGLNFAFGGQASAGGKVEPTPPGQLRIRFALGGSFAIDAPAIPKELSMQFAGGGAFDIVGFEVSQRVSLSFAGGGALSLDIEEQASAMAHVAFVDTTNSKVPLLWGIADDGNPDYLADSIADDLFVPAAYGANIRVAASDEFVVIAPSSTGTGLLVYKRLDDGKYEKRTITGYAGTGALTPKITKNSSHIVVTTSGSTALGLLKRVGDDFEAITAPPALTKNPNNIPPLFFGTDSEFCAISLSTTPFVQLYSISGDTWTQLSDPASLPGQAPGGMVATPDGSVLMLGLGFSPWLEVYTRSGSTFTKATAPGTVPTGAVTWADITDDGSLAVFGHNTSPYMSVYSISGSTLTKLADPASLPSGNARSVAFNQAGNQLIFTTGASTYFYVYDISGGTLTLNTSKDPNPPYALTAQTINFNYLTRIPGTDQYVLRGPMTVMEMGGDGLAYVGDAVDWPNFGTSSGVAYDPIGGYLYLSLAASPWINVFKRQSDDTFDLLSSSVFSTLPTGSGAQSPPAVSPNGLLVAQSHNTSPYLTVWSRSGDTWTKLANPASAPGTTARGAVWESDTVLHIGVNASPWLFTYDLIGGVLTRRADPAVTPSALPLGLAFSNGVLAVAYNATPFIQYYSSDGSTLTALTGPTLPDNTSGLSFSSDGLVLASNLDGSPYVNLNIKVAGNFEVMTPPATMPTSSNPAFGALFFIGPDDVEYLYLGTAAGILRYTYSAGVLTYVDTLNPIKFTYAAYIPKG